MTVVYEWDVETVSSVESDQYEFEEVIDHFHCKSLKEAYNELMVPTSDETTMKRIVLVRDDDFYRAWACFELWNGLVVPETQFFDADGRPHKTIPQRFMTEVNKLNMEIVNAS